MEMNKLLDACRIVMLDEFLHDYFQDLSLRKSCDADKTQLLMALPAIAFTVVLRHINLNPELWHRVKHSLEIGSALMMVM